MRVVIIDDDELICIALKTILSASKIEVAALGHSADDAVNLYFQHHPDIIILDIRMPGENGIEAAGKILARDGNARILFLTTFSDDEYIIQALRIGAKGYFLKQQYEGIVDSLYAIQQGQCVFGDMIASKFQELLHKKESSKELPCDLSEKELELIQHVAQGKSNREIALSLYLSEGTVRNYLSSICDKLNVKSRTQLVVYYYNHLR